MMALTTHGMDRDGGTERQLVERNFRATGRGCVFNINHAKNFAISAESNEKHGFLPVDAVLSKIGELKKTYVTTDAKDLASEKLKRCHHLTLTGAPGEGKTSIALMICEEYHRQNYEILFVDDLDSFDEKQCYMITSNTCIVMDDIFGTIGISTNLQKIDKTLNTLNEIIKQKLTQQPRDARLNMESLSLGTRPREVPVKIKVVFTSKTFNLNEGCQHLPQYNVNLFRKETIVDLSAESLSKDYKRNILSSLQREYPDVCLSGNAIKEITEVSNPVFGFPLTSKLYFSEPVFQVLGVRFFREPLNFLRNNIDALMKEKSNRKVILIILALCGGKLNLISFQENPEAALSSNIVEGLRQILPDSALASGSVYEEALNFEGTYCVRQEGIVSFSHPSIYDAVTCAMVNVCPVLLLKHCTLKFIFERVRLNKQQGRGDIFVDHVSNIVYVTRQYQEILVTRMSGHIKQGYYRLTLAHPMFKDKNLFLRLLDNILKDLHDIVLCRDKESGESFLYWCTFSHNDFIVEQTLKCIQHIKEDVIRSIKACIHNGNLKAMKLLIEQVHTQDDIPLHALAKSCKLATVAAGCRHADIFQYLKDNDIDLQTKDEDGRTVLHLSCEGGHYEIVKLIPEHLITDFVNMQDFSGRTPLMLCAEFGHLRLFKLLTEKGADLTEMDHHSNTCLHLAAMKGHNPVLDFILMKEPNLVSCRDSHGRTPVMAAARFGRDEAFSHLLTHSDMSETDDFNNSILCLAAFGGSPAIVFTVLGLPNTDINQKGENNRGALQTAAVCGHKEVFDLLLSRNADISCIDSFDNNCLHHSCYGKNKGICQKILSLKPEYINSQTSVGRTPILIAAKEGAKNIVELLLSKDANKEITDHANNSCLHQACMHGHIQLVQYLLNLKTFDVNRRGRFGWTPIMVAARLGHEKIFQLLLSHESDLSFKDDNNNDLLWLACCGGNASIVTYLLSLKKFDINRLGENGYTPAMAAVKKGQRETFEIACAEGADLNLTDDYENNVLSLAAAGGNGLIVRRLLTRFDINRRGELGRTPVMAAARKGNTEVVQMLVEEDADISLTDSQNNNCLSLASKSCDGEVVSYLMSLNIFDPNVKGELKRPAVLSAASTGNVQGFNTLVSQEADVLVRDDHAYDCLGLAAKGGSASIVRRLLGMQIFNVNRQGCHGYSPIMHAAAKGDFRIFQLLMAEGGNVSLVDHSGNDLLTLSVVGGSVHIVKYLLSMNIFDINRPGTDGMTPVFAAAKHGHQDVFDNLVNKRADMSVPDKFKNNCFLAAAAGGNIHIMKYLLTLQVFDINCRGQSGWTPVMTASVKGHRQIFDVLRGEGADIHLKDNDGNGCLILATMNNRSDFVRYLLSLKVFDINCRGKGGKTAVMFAALKGHVRTFFVLVSEGADLTLFDDGSMSCAECAITGSKQPIVRHFLNDEKVQEPISGLPVESADQKTRNQKNCIIS